MLTIALSTGCLHSYGIARAFELAAEADFDAVEIMVDHRWDSRQPAYLQRLARDHGLPIAAIHNPCVPHVPGWPQDPLGRLQESAALAHAVGASAVVAHLPMCIRAVRIELFGFRAHTLLVPILLPSDRGYRPSLLNGLA